MLNVSREVLTASRAVLSARDEHATMTTTPKDMMASNNPAAIAQTAERFVAHHMNWETRMVHIVTAATTRRPVNIHSFE
jgi:hypothetical protein